MPDALFVPAGEGWEPTQEARGPWSPRTLHGGPVAALLVRAVEACTTEGAGPFHLARVTVELLRPVGLAPLAVRAELARPGAKVQLVEATLDQGGRPVAAARALRMRTAAVPLPRGEALLPGPEALPPDPEALPPDPEALPPDPEALPPGQARVPPGPDRGRRMSSPRSDGPGFHTTGTELRFVSGTFVEPGPAMVWARLAVPVVPGEVPSPTQRAVAAADFGNGVGSALPFSSYSFINPDLTVHLSRAPVGEWVGLEADMQVGDEGVGLAQSRLWDQGGVVGRSLQSILVEKT